ncbi:Os06g0727600 [Oryza sativa Japonica Group]|uniref:Os06g0727600 protein n=1 Tax=Oryza sativa subsp. japonica TaxID=39947 RepID=A0A0P0X1B1_ORYSJ|nr:Os06g0727600 [Oryza sativa Japonica Group]
MRWCGRKLWNFGKGNSLVAILLTLTKWGGGAMAVANQDFQGPVSSPPPSPPPRVAPSDTTSSSASNINILNKYMSLWAAPFSVRNSTTANFSSNATISGPKEKSKIEAEAVQVSRKKAAEERLPPGIVVRESDLHLRRLWGNPTSDVASGKQYLLTMSVGYTEKANVNATIHKLSDKFDIVLFHYDGRTSEWEEFEWSKKVVHVSARKQAKWWFAKRFLHPSIVAAYEYVFVWDEDLGVDNFTAEEYISIVRKHALDISQPGLDGTKGRRQYPVTVRRPSGDMHNSGRFVEVMAPVFSRDAWACVWHMIQASALRTISEFILTYS